MAGKQKPKEENLFEELIKLRDMHRKRVENGCGRRQGQGPSV